MNAYIFILTVIICEVVTLQERLDYYDVGTVLFNPSDLNKKRWSIAEVELLRARKRFLDILPPLDALNSNNGDLTDSMFDYFKNTYSALKNEAGEDVETISLLTTALSDTIGGYMKMWILPVTKFAYYGGTVNQDNALKLFQFHDDIKTYLNTDGKGWHNPNPNFLNAMSISVAPLPKARVKNAEPCEALAYFQKTKNGLAIPVPTINWDKGSETMFIPLKNQCTMSLNCPNSSDALFKYYSAVQNCIESNVIEDSNSFEERFQNWLFIDVIPHLNNEKLYPALRSVLTLVNKTRSIGDSAKDCPVPNSRRTCIAGIPVDLSSKKMMVITIIIFLEVAWCIPTLCYLMFTTIKKRSHKNNVYFFIEPKSPPCKQTHHTAWAESTQYTPTTNMSLIASREMNAVASKISTAIGHSQQMVSFNTQAVLTRTSGRSIAAGNRDNFMSQLQPTKLDTFEQGTTQRYSKKNSISLSFFPCDKKEITPISNYDMNCNNTPQRELESEAASVTTVQNLQDTKTVTLLKARSPILRSPEIISYVDDSKKIEKINIKNETKKTKTNAKVALTPSIEDNGSKNKETPTTEKTPKTKMKSNRQNNKKDLKASKKEAKHSSGKPYLEITIDRPKREISVDISSPIKIAKASKIPKRFFANTVTQTMCIPSKKTQNNYKSLIPQPKRQYTVDDIDIHSTSTSKPKDCKFNLTL